jgi:hypothetical protein
MPEYHQKNKPLLLLSKKKELFGVFAHLTVSPTVSDTTHSPRESMIE